MTIKLNKFGKTFNSRMSADTIFNKVVDFDSIIVDFQGIDDATPSFCHEMMVVLQAKKIKLETINANESIKLQLNKALSSI